MVKPIIRACPICGNPDLKWVGGGPYIIFDFIGRTSLSGRFLCHRCGNEVNPIKFDSKEEYLKFVKKKRKEEAEQKAGTKADKDK
ncbi:hypothetical protein DRN67_02375 [Candidatus Micrarchaeota archaeon]|mgnify:CR=1 FL=1|nr:MAG: hypothetical protein DRN67_02375 [Candidatus Micrarchaeota archaeon]